MSSIRDAVLAHPLAVSAGGLVQAAEARRALRADALVASTSAVADAERELAQTITEGDPDGRVVDVTRSLRQAREAEEEAANSLAASEAALAGAVDRSHHAHVASMVAVWGDWTDHDLPADLCAAVLHLSSLLADHSALEADAETLRAWSRHLSARVSEAGGTLNVPGFDLPGPGSVPWPMWRPLRAAIEDLARKLREANPTTEDRP
jgi:DNA-binding PucR family transcriptional regulator